MRNDALTDLEIVFRQVEFSIRLLSYCERAKIDPTEFDTGRAVLLEKENLLFPQGHFSELQNIINAANISILSTLGGSALTLDKAWEVARICPSSKQMGLLSVFHKG